MRFRQLTLTVVIASSLLGGSLALAATPFQNNLLWIGNPLSVNQNPNRQTGGEEVTIIEVPLVADPDLQQATFGWMQNLNIDACVLGLSQRITGQNGVIGPYSTSTVTSFSRGCG